MPGNSNIGLTVVDFVVAGAGGLLAYLAVKRFAVQTPDPKTPVSEHFLLADFLKSDLIPELMQYPVQPKQWANVVVMCRDVLEPLWARWGPVIITSGGRPIDITDKAGKRFFELLQEQGASPAERSQHADFSAVDIKMTKRAAFQPAFQWLVSNPSVRQVILYLDNDGYPRTIHVGLYTREWGTAKNRAMLYHPQTRYVAATEKALRERIAV